MGRLRLTDAGTQTKSVFWKGGFVSLEQDWSENNFCSQNKHCVFCNTDQQLIEIWSRYFVKGSRLKVQGSRPEELYPTIIKIRGLRMIQRSLTTNHPIAFVQSKLSNQQNSAVRIQYKYTHNHIYIHNRTQVHLAESLTHMQVIFSPEGPKHEQWSGSVGPLPHTLWAPGSQMANLVVAKRKWITTHFVLRLIEYNHPAPCRTNTLQSSGSRSGAAHTHTHTHGVHSES